MNQTLLIIDPQNDFCDKNGSLYVPGAQEDCERLTAMINRSLSQFSSIHVTLDSHHLFHIANPLFWVDDKGQNPPPFTVISSDMVMNKIYKPSVVQYQHYAEEYVSTLERTGKYKLCIWPPHCLLGSWGHSVHSLVYQALYDWETSAHGRMVDFTYKGSNAKTEHYSAIRAEVCDASDPGSRTNFALIERLKTADSIGICGEALSHCVANTIRDLLTCIPAEKMTILTDLSSNVPGFESYGNDFLIEVQQLGVKTMTSIDFCQ